MIGKINGKLSGSGTGFEKQEFLKWNQLVK